MEYIKKKRSFPVWERGLKLLLPAPGSYPPAVVPRVGTWIETNNLVTAVVFPLSRSPCGNVD